MKDGVAVVNSEETPNFCTLADLEICERGADYISTVDQNGDPDWYKESYLGETEFAYYYCGNCEQDWAKTAVQDQDRCWELAKEHLNGN